MLDLTKPIQTRGGKKVRILCTDADCTYLGVRQPIVGTIDGSPPYSWAADGQFAAGELTETDLVNAPIPKKKVKVEVRLMKAVNGSVVAVAYSDEEDVNWTAGNPKYLDSITIEMEYEDQ